MIVCFSLGVVDSDVETTCVEDNVEKIQVCVPQTDHFESEL